MIDWNYIASVIATVAFDIIYFGAIIGTIVIVILDNRNPVKTMAWILILMFLPVVGLVFYFFFGRSQRREKIIGKKSYNRLLKKPMAEYLAQNCCETPKEYARLIQLFQNTNQAFPFEGTGRIFIPADILNFRLYCESCKRPDSIFIWNIISLKMIRWGVWCVMY